MIFLYLAQFHNHASPLVDRTHTFLVAVQRTFPGPEMPRASTIIHQTVRMRSDLLCEVNRVDSGSSLNIKDTTGLKCRDTAQTHLGMVVRQDDLVEWLEQGMPHDRKPHFFQLCDL